MKRRQSSAIKIQKFFRSYMVRKNKSRFKVKTVVHTERDIDILPVALIIQRVYRGFLGRMRYRVIRITKHREREQRKYESRNSVFKLYFEQHGAAFRIQKWARTRLKCSLIVLERRRAFIQMKKLSSKAKKIQRAYRRYVLRREGKILLKELLRKREENLVEVCAVRIQALVRGYLSRQKNINYYKWKRVQTKPDVNAAKMSALNRFMLVYKTHARVSGIIDTDLSEPFRPRRGGLSLNNFRIRNEVHIKYFEAAALQIQTIWRGYRSRKFFRNYRNTLRNKSARRIQRWFVWSHWRRKFLLRVKHHQPIWRAKFRMEKLQLTVISTIQRLWRGYKARCRVSAIWRHRHRHARAIQSFFRRCQRRAAVRIRRVQLRKLLEEVKAGEIFYAKSLEYRRIDEFWRGVRKKPGAPHELQTLFTCLSPNGMLEMGRLLKFVKQCHGLLDKQLDAKSVEIMFAKLRRPPEKRLDYSQFVGLVLSMATDKYSRVLDSAPSSPVRSSRASGSVTSSKDGIRSSTKDQRSLSPVSVISRTAASIAERQKVAVSTMSTVSSLGSIDGDSTTGDGNSVEGGDDSVPFHYGRLRGRGALITCFVDQYMAPHKAFRSVVSELKASASFPRAQAIVTKAVVKLQHFARTRLQAKSIWRSGLAMRQLYRLSKQDSATRKIQRVYRGWKGRRRAVPFAQKVYVKCVDADAGVPYWFNSTSEVAFWSKPPLLREFDCGEAVMMPPDDEMCTASCSDDTCGRAATMYCNECDSIMCQPCAAKIHESGRRKGHSIIQLTQCSQCGFQLVSRYCRACMDHYCDCCFAWVHRRGRLRLHTATWVCDRCDSCESRSAWWGVQDPEREYKSTLYCRLCFVSLFGPEDPSSRPNTFPVQYFGPAVHDHIQKRRIEEEKRIQEAKYQAMMAAAARARQEAAAYLLQRVYRGHRSRKQSRKFLAERRKYLLLREKDNEKRKTLTHRLLDAVGMAPPLASDTDIEFGLRKFPTRLKKTAADCLDNDVALIAELAGKKKRKGRRTLREGYEALRGLYAAKWKARKLRQRQEAKDRALAATRQQVSLAKKMSASQKDLEHKKTKSKAALAKLEAAKVDYQTGLKEVEAAREKWLEYWDGPTGPLKRIVAQRRKHGIPIGVNGRVTRNSRYLRIKKDDLATFNAKTSPGCFIVIQGASFKLVTGDLFVEAFDKAGGILSMASSSSSQSLLSQEKARLDSNGDDAVVAPPGSHLTLQDDDDEQQVEPDLDFDLDDETSVMLDRPWSTASKSHVPLFRVARKPLHSRITFELSRTVFLSPPSQLVVRGIVRTLHSLSLQTERMAVHFDEDGKAAERCLAIAGKLAKTRDNMMQRSTRAIKLKFKDSPPVPIRERLAGIGRAFRTLLSATQAHAEHIRSIQKMSPYNRWELSIQKETIKCFLELDDGTDPKLLGQFDMDPDAPCIVMREYIERRFREPLNKTTGEDFNFFLPGAGGGQILQRNQEGRAWSKDYAKFPSSEVEANSKRDASPTKKRTAMKDLVRSVIITPDRALAAKGAELSIIPEFND